MINFKYNLKTINSNNSSIVSQKIFTDEGISFVSFTYLVKINSENLEFKLKKDEIEEIKWFNKTGKKYGVQLYSCSEGSKINSFMDYNGYKHVIASLEEDLPVTYSLPHVRDCPSKTQPKNKVWHTKYDEEEKENETKEEEA